MFEVLLGSLIGLFRFTQTVDTKPQSWSTVNLNRPLTPNGSYRESVQLEPMNQLQFRNVTRQAYDHSCGPMAFTTLLDYYLGRNLEERQVIEGLLCYDEVDKIAQHRGFSLFDMKRYIATLGYKSGGSHTEFNGLDALGYPALVPIHCVGFKHFVVVYDVYNDHAFVADPALDNISFARTRFEEIWDQNVLSVIFPSGQGLRNALTLSDRNMCLVGDRTVSLPALRGFLQVNKITENQVHELSTGGDIIHLRTK